MNEKQRRPVIDSGVVGNICHRGKPDIEKLERKTQIFRSNIIELLLMFKIYKKLNHYVNLHFIDCIPSLVSDSNL